jgi:predicted GNAT superfamily acetyltransferase
MPEVEVRELSTLEELREASELYERVWGEPVMSVELMRAMSAHGCELLGAYAGGRIVGAQTAFLSRHDDEIALHSHVTGVDATVQHQGIGAVLKWAQRDWALGHGIEVVTWTFDPMVARNAYFNLQKLGARAVRFLRNFYGVMSDAFNAGERSDRLEIRWELRHPRVEAAAEGRTEPGAGPEGLASLLRNREGRPVPADAEAEVATVEVPSDYLALRADDPDLARTWRDAVADALEGAFDRGYEAVGFLRSGAYLLERR